MALTFHAPLQTSLIPLIAGDPSFTFARNSIAFALDHEGVLQRVAINEARFQGARRVRNMVDSSISSATWGVSNITLTSGVADPLGGTAAKTLTATAASGGCWHTVNGAAAGRVFCGSMWLRRRTGTGAVFIRQPSGLAGTNINIASVLTSSWQRFATTGPHNGVDSAYSFTVEIATSGDAVDLAFDQCEDVSGQSNQAPGDYVSVGALSSPWHGAGIDGVKYFNTTNKNYVAQNLVQQSQTFDNAYWTKYEAVVTPNAIAAPDSTMTADMVADNAVNLPHRFVTPALSSVVGATYTISVYLKAGTATWANVHNAHGSAENWANFNLVTGKIGFKDSAGTVAQMVALPNGWYRCSITFVCTATAIIVMVYMMNGDINSNYPPYVGTGQTIYAWGLQLEPGPIANPYVPTTAAAVTTNVVTEAPGVPIPDSLSFGYVPENAATNLVQQSQTFDAPPWVTNDFPVTPNNQVAPDGTLTADTLTDNTTNGMHRIYTTSGGSVAAGPVTVSVYAKKGTLTWMQISVYDGVASPFANFNLATGALGFVTGAGAIAAVQTLPNGWYRCSITWTAAAYASLNVIFYASNTNINSTPSYAGTGQTMYLWGAQVEQAPNPSSYIPTVGASMVRNAEVLRYQWLLNLDGVVGSSYSETYPFNVFNVSTAVWEVLCGNGGGIGFPAYHPGNGGLNGSGATTANGRVGKSLNKNALAWSGTTITACLNGGAFNEQSYAPANFPNSGILDVGGSNGSACLAGCIRNLRFYNNRFTNAQLQSLTADAKLKTFNGIAI